VHSDSFGHIIAADDYDHIERIKNLLTYLPQNTNEKPPVYDRTDDPCRLCPELDDIIPESDNRAYDIKEVIGQIVDNGVFVEHMAGFAANMITCLSPPAE